MTEENIIAEFSDEEYEAIEVLDLTPVVTKSETVQVVNAEDIETFTVGTEESFPALGEPNEQLKHSTLMGRDLQDQHPITAITGLRNELDDIEALKTVYSDKKQSADFYKWEDENPNNENRVGYFVTICDDIRTIKICKGEDIFGVTVDDAAFVGGQDDISRDYKYSLVTHSGIVNVRCELDVVVGDFVVSNEYGIAEKTNNDYGCKVIAINEINGLRCATICLNMPIEQLSSIGYKLVNFDSRIDGAEKGVTVAMNLANDAYNKAVNANNSSGDALNNANDAVDRINEALDQLDGNISEIQKQASEARAISQSAATHAENLRTEAVNRANESLTEVNKLIKDLEPVTTWVDLETGNTGAEYLTTYIKNGVATTTEIRTANTNIDNNKIAIADNKSAIEKSATKFSSLISSISKYSVGEYSQSYGLTQEQAESVLSVGIVYIPTDSHNEEISGTKNSFSKGRYYTWNGEDWDESAIGRVNFVHSTAPSTTLNDYWYINANEAPSGYEPKALYIAQDGEWIKVNTLSGNSLGRATSMIYQTANAINLEVTSVKGDLAGVHTIIDNGVVTTDMIASAVNKDGTVNTASIVASVNNSDSSVAINADKIVMTGTTTFLTAKDVGSTGATVIDGGRVTTGKIQSSNGATWINLDKGTFQFSNKNGEEVLGLDTSNNLNVYGKIKNSDYPMFSIQVGPSRQYGGSNGAFTVTDASAGTIFSNHDIFQVYKVGTSDAEGVVWTAPFLTNIEETNRKGVAVFPDSIGMFNDMGAKYTNDKDEVSYPWITQVSVKENTVLLSNGKTEISLADDNTGLWIGGGTDFWFNGGNVPEGWTKPTRYVFNNPYGGYAKITCGKIDCTYINGANYVYTPLMTIGGTNGAVYQNYVLSIFGNTYTEGTFSASNFINISDRELKTNIEEVELSALDKISQLKFYSYDYKTSEQDEFNIKTPTLYNSPATNEGENVVVEETTTSNPVHVDLGIMADEAPTEIQSVDGKGIDLYSYISLNAKAVQELILKIQTLEEEIQSLKNGEI